MPTKSVCIHIDNILKTNFVQPPAKRKCTSFRARHNNMHSLVFISLSHLQRIPHTKQCIKSNLNFFKRRENFLPYSFTFTDTMPYDSRLNNLFNPYSSTYFSNQKVDWSLISLLN